MNSWFNKTGADSDVVISTRIRLARNIFGFAFPARWSDEEASEVTKRVRAAAGDGFEFLNLDNAPSLNKNSLVEEHLISREMLNGKNKSLLLSQSEDTSIMVGEEDHIRLQVISAGFDIDAAAKKANELDDMLSEKLDYAFDTHFGYLTQCPTNVGTGLRASVMLHLPALCLTKRINPIITQVSKIGLTIRGIYGEGSSAKGNLYQLSNQVTLGISEEQTYEKLKNVTLQIIKTERELRKKLLENNESELADTIWRAFGILSYARSLSSDECEDLLSKVKLGINMGIIKDISGDEITRLMIKSEPAHISLASGAALSASERDKARADMIRDALTEGRD